jgi:hypothetical protein
MNQELADAGIDRVRVMSVPGPPKAVGTWLATRSSAPPARAGQALRRLRRSYSDRSALQRRQ